LASLANDFMPLLAVRGATGSAGFSDWALAAAAAPAFAAVVSLALALGFDFRPSGCCGAVDADWSIGGVLALAGIGFAFASLSLVATSAVAGLVGVLWAGEFDADCAAAS
jgi:hypothetical protein